MCTYISSADAESPTFNKSYVWQITGHIFSHDTVYSELYVNQNIKKSLIHQPQNKPAIISANNGLAHTTAH
jgi:hypothetical protein